MKVTIVRSLEGIVIPNDDPKGPLFTKDGAKLIDLRISGTDISSALTMAVKSLVEVLPEDSAERTLYMSMGTLSTNPNETTYSMVVGISGVSDLEKRLHSLHASEAPKEAPKVAPKVAPTVSSYQAPVVSTSIEDTGDTDDAVVVESE